MAPRGGGSGQVFYLCEDGRRKPALLEEFYGCCAGDDADLLAVGGAEERAVQTLLLWRKAHGLSCVPISSRSQARGTEIRLSVIVGGQSTAGEGMRTATGGERRRGEGNQNSQLFAAKSKKGWLAVSRE